MLNFTYVWKTLDKIMSISHLCRSFNFFVCNAIFSIPDILCYCSGKKNGLLIHNTNVFTQPLQVQTTNVMAINSYLGEDKSTWAMLITTEKTQHHELTYYVRSWKWLTKIRLENTIQSCWCLEVDPRSRDLQEENSGLNWTLLNPTLPLSNSSISPSSEKIT